MLENSVVCWKFSINIDRVAAVANESSGNPNSTSQQMSELLIINAVVVNSQLNVSVTANSIYINQSALENFIQLLTQSISNIVEHCLLVIDNESLLIREDVSSEEIAGKIYEF